MPDIGERMPHARHMPKTRVQPTDFRISQQRFAKRRVRFAWCHQGMCVDSVLPLSINAEKKSNLKSHPEGDGRVASGFLPPFLTL